MRMHDGETRGPIEASMQAKVRKRLPVRDGRLAVQHIFPAGRLAIACTFYTQEQMEQNSLRFGLRRDPFSVFLAGALTRLKNETHNRIAICFSVHARRGE